MVIIVDYEANCIHLLFTNKIDKQYYYIQHGNCCEVKQHKYARQGHAWQQADY